jgi:hypothetical protein
MIKKFKIFEVYNEDDPYGEDDWEEWEKFDDTYVDYEEGDKIICIKPTGRLIKGAEYRCEEIYKQWSDTFVKIRDLNNGWSDGGWFKERFKKKT